MDTKAKNSDSFEITLPSDVEFLVTREFNAPRDLVFEAWTKPEHVRRWWHPYGEMTACEIDLRVGGAWRYAFPSEHGEIGFNGVYQEIVRPERIVHTLIFEPMPDVPGLVTVTMEEKNGKTRVTELSRLPSKQDRDNVLATGMESGARIAYDRLETLLGDLQSIEA